MNLEVKDAIKIINQRLEDLENVAIEKENLKELKYIKVADVKDPVRGHETDAGIDFFVPNNFEAITLKPGEDIKIPSGIKLIVPRGYALIFKEKSGIALNRKLTVGACVVDSDYRGEVNLHLFNNGTEPTTIEAGDKIVQGVIVPVLLSTPIEITEEEYNSNITERGEGGFGSTGIK